MGRAGLTLFEFHYLRRRKIASNQEPTLRAAVVMDQRRNPSMANQRNPDDPYRSDLTDDDIRRQARLDSELQPDPELAEGPASSGKVAMFAIAIAVVLGAVFYGLNNSSINQAGTSPPAQNTAQTSSQSSPPAAPPGMRDVSPRANTDQGTTTGAAPPRPSAPAEMNRSANPPAGNPPPSK
jgi:hypothetical protein